MVMGCHNLERGEARQLVGHPPSGEALNMFSPSSPRTSVVPPSVSQNSSFLMGRNLSFNEQFNNREKECQPESILNDAPTLSKETITSGTSNGRAVKDTGHMSVNSFTSSEFSTEDTTNAAKSSRREAVQADQGFCDDRIETYFRRACDTAQVAEPAELAEPAVKRRRQNRAGVDNQKCMQHQHSRSHFMAREARRNLPPTSSLWAAGNDGSWPEHQEAFPELNRQEP